MVLGQYLSSGGSDSTVVKTLVRLEKFFAFEKMSKTRFCDWNCLRVDPKIPTISFFNTQAGWERWWQFQLKDPGLHLYPDEKAVGFKKGFIALEIEKIISVSHEWCHLLQIDGEHGVGKHEIKADYDRSVKLKVIAEREREATSWSQDFFMNFGEEILNIDFCDYQLKKHSLDQLILFEGQI